MKKIIKQAYKYIKSGEYEKVDLILDTIDLDKEYFICNLFRKVLSKPQYNDYSKKMLLKFDDDLIFDLSDKIILTGDLELLSLLPNDRRYNHSYGYVFKYDNQIFRKVWEEDILNIRTSCKITDYIHITTLDNLKYLIEEQGVSYIVDKQPIYYEDGYCGYHGKYDVFHKLIQFDKYDVFDYLVSHYKKNFLNK